MEPINLEHHYRAFQWALSKNWKDRNRLHYSIQRKMESLTREYGLSRKEIQDKLFSAYWERGQYKRFDPEIGSLNNWVAGYVNLYLNNIIRQHAVRRKEEPIPKIDPLDLRNSAQVIYADRNNSKEDTDFQPEVLIDRTNPESLLMAKELMERITGSFDQVEIRYLVGDLNLHEAAELTGVSETAFRKRIERRRTEFLKQMS